MGKKVVTVDVDLEAPGLAYKLLDEPPTRCDGLVGWLRDRLANGEPPLSIGDSLVDVPVEEPFVDGGWLRLMPAGRNPSLNYFQDLAGLQLEQRINAGDGVDAFVDLKQQIEADLAPDLLLLDARTGISSTNLVTTRVLADDVIALSLDSREQHEGTRSVLRSLTPLTSLQTGEPLRLHVVLARIAGRSVDIGSYAVTDEERAVRDRTRRPDLARALLELAAGEARVGRRPDAVAPTEQAVEIYEQLAADNPAFLNDLASSLNNLGVRYREVGRRADAAEAAGRAVELSRPIAHGLPAFGRPMLAARLRTFAAALRAIGDEPGARAASAESERLTAAALDDT